jgi:hypothetical protein
MTAVKLEDAVGLASMARPVTQERIKTLVERGFCKPGDAENRLGDFVGQIGC